MEGGEKPKSFRSASMVELETRWRRSSPLGHRTEDWIALALAVVAQRPQLEEAMRLLGRPDSCFGSKDQGVIRYAYSCKSEEGVDENRELYLMTAGGEIVSGGDNKAQSNDALAWRPFQAAEWSC